MAPITSGGKKPPRPPAAPTRPVTAPTRAGGLASATQANTDPAPIPIITAIRMKSTAANPLPSSGLKIIQTARSAAPPHEIAVIRRGPNLSDSAPPIGRAMTAAMAKPAVRAPADLRSWMSYTSAR